MRLPKIAKTLEKDVQAAVMDYLRLHGVFVVRINSGAFAGEYKGRKRFVRFNSEPGCADLLCVFPDGRFGALEVKRIGWKFRPNDAHEAEQAAFLATVRQRGGIGEFVTGIDDVRRVMLAAGYEVG